MNSVLTAGIDPALDTLPKFIQEKAAKQSKHSDDYIYAVLTESYIPSLEALEPHVAACKPNAAFFEQYGLAGMRAYSDILIAAKRLGIPSIADAKRGDIGSTAEAYAKAFLGGATARFEKVLAFEADSLTVNPYLGADTLEVFALACERNAKGLFVLVKTSNPGSNWLQSISDDKESIAKKVAKWVSERGEALIGDKGVSSIGAVVGATYPDEARELRAIMKNNMFLIPGYGAQGGTASDAVAGFAKNSIANGASTVNVSRGLFNIFSQDFENIAGMQEALISKAKSLNSELNQELLG